MIKLKCPICGELHGGLVNDLFDHMRQAHGTVIAWYEWSTGNGDYGPSANEPRHPFQLEFVEVE